MHGAMLMEDSQRMPQPVESLVDYQTHPDRYAHLKLSVEAPIARIVIDVQEDRGIRPGYKLKLNSYDLGVDIELPTRCSASASSTLKCAA